MVVGLGRSLDILKTDRRMLNAYNVRLYSLFVYNEIIKGLFVGDAQDAKQFVVDKPDGVIYCVLEGRPTDEPIKSVSIQVLGTDQRIIKSNKQAVLRLIHDDLVQGKDVLVHCGAGIERSPLVVACYLADYHEMSMDDAYKKVIANRPQAQDRRIWL